MLGGGTTDENKPLVECTICGCRAELHELPLVEGKYCLACSADIGTSLILKTEIDAATMAGERTDLLMAEFTSISDQLIKRAQNKRNAK